MNKILQSELWEIQAILYFILSYMIETKWLSTIIAIWGLITVIGAVVIRFKEGRKERKLNEKGK